MAMTDQEKTDVAVELIRRIFVSPNVTAHGNLDDIKAAIGKIDDAMGATINQIDSAGYGAITLEIVLKTEAQAGAVNLTTQQAGLALAYWALKRVGLL